MKISCRALIIITAVLLVMRGAPAGAMEWGVAKSADGVPIGYSVQGKGDITLVFIYGWSRDSMYWREQVSFFEKNYRIVTATSRGTATRDLGVPNAPSSGTPSPPTAATS